MYILYVCHSSAPNISKAAPHLRRLWSTETTTTTIITTTTTTDNNNNNNIHINNTII